VEPAAFQRQIAAFLQGETEEDCTILVAVDGKTLRGTIPRGQSQGVHLLAAYIPEEGIVLAQVAIGAKENEIAQAPQLLAEIDLRHKVVIGDAMQTQRKLSSQIVESGGDYIWVVKDNQSQLRADIATWFQPENCVKGFSPGVKDFQSARSVDKAHGRREERSLTTSSMLNEYLDWPHVGQVFELQRRTTEMATGVVQQETVYGITSLDAHRVSAQQLNSLVRQYWGIENGLHYRRDRSLHEDATRFSNPQLAENMATLNNLIIGLIKQQHWNNLPQARRHYDARLHEAIQLICRRTRRTL
jgi:predicted transposase YbfD/YdcC